MQPLTDIAELSPEWLTSALAETVSARVIGCEIERIGEASGMASRLYRLTLQYQAQEANEAPDTGPNTLILKLALDTGELRDLFAERGLATREAVFYQRFADVIPVRIPQPYFSTYDTQAQTLTILMEDFGLWRTYEGEVHVTLPDAERAMVALARVHAKFWNDPVIEIEALTPLTDGSDRKQDAERFQRGADALDELPISADYLKQCLVRLAKYLPKMPSKTPVVRPVTLLHGDFHHNNLAFTETETLIFDWQLIERGPPAMDLATFIYVSLSNEDRRDHQDRLIDAYLSALHREGVRYTKRQLMTSLRQAMVITIAKNVIALDALDNDLMTRRMDHANQVAQDFNMLSLCRLFPLVIIWLRLRAALQRRP